MVIYNTIPIFTAILAFVFLNERLRIVQILAMGVAFLGVTLVSLSSPSESGKSQIGGLLLMTLASLFFSSGFTLNRMVNASLHWLSNPFYVGVVMVATILVALVLQPWLGVLHFELYDSHVLACMVGTAGSGIAATVLMSYAFSMAKAGLASAIVSVEIGKIKRFNARLVYAFAFNSLFFGNEVRLLSAMGSSVILGAVVIIAWSNRVDKS